MAFGYGGSTTLDKVRCQWYAQAYGVPGQARGKSACYGCCTRRGQKGQTRPDKTTTDAQGEPGNIIIVIVRVWSLEQVLVQSPARRTSQYCTCSCTADCMTSSVQGRRTRNEYGNPMDGGYDEGSEKGTGACWSKAQGRDGGHDGVQ